MITIQQVTTKKQQKQFVQFPLDLYKGNKCFVPPLYADELAMFKPNYVYNEQADSIWYLAYNEQGQVVGRIQGILQRTANEKWGQSRIRFTRFDAINDKEVADKLFQAVENWGRELGVQEIVGPLGYSDMEREGLLIEGFEYLATFEEQYNYDYYQTLIEDLGYQKDVDWLEHRLTLPEGGLDERIMRLSKKCMERYNLRFDETKSMKKFLKKYVNQIFDLIDYSYNELYGTVPLTEPLKKQLLSQFKLLIRRKFISVIIDEKDKIVAFGIGFPGIGEAVQKSGGRLTIPTLLRLLPLLNKPKVVDLALIGVVGEYKNKGISPAMLPLLANMMSSVEYMETNLNLEDNHAIRNMWKNFESIQHKRRRCYIKQLNPTQE